MAAKGIRLSQGSWGALDRSAISGDNSRGVAPAERSLAPLLSTPPHVGTTMPEKYEGLGFSLLYPETWRIDEDPDARSVNLETPTGAFLSITLSDNLQPDFERAQKAMEAEYDEVELETNEVELAGHTFHGITQRFVFLDLIITSQLLKLETGSKNYLVQIQGEDREIEAMHPVFRAILTSMCQSLSAVGS